MRGDVTRQTFRNGNHYRSVLQQQGRVQLDADWNEQADIQAYLDRTVTADLLGGSGAPRRNAGMLIGNKAGKPHSEPVAAAKLWISTGHYYVDGILCENDDAVQLEAQPDLPGVALPKDDGPYIAYLDVWSEHVTRLEDPLLQEVALGGPDTTTRARTIWQVRLRSKDTEPDPADVETLAARKAKMLARAVAPTTEEPTPCVVGPAAGYRRLENQLYRVEVFDPGDKSDTPTFLWSRENSSVVAAVTDIKVVSNADPKEDTGLLTIAAPGRDDRLAFEKGDWVEVTDRARTRRGERGFLVELGVVDGTRLPIVRWYGTRRPGDDDLEDHPVARRWDGKAVPQPLFPDPSAPPGTPVEGGIHVEFDPDGTYRTGDYWLIPARTANLEGGSGDTRLSGTIDWPTDTFQPPAGVVHHYADIAELTLADGTWMVDHGHRSIFDPLNAHLDATVAGGDGQESLPDTVLDEPLRVAVTRNLRPVQDATVHFATEDGGLFVSQDPATAGEGVPLEIDVKTDEFGIAKCQWQLDANGKRTQRVTARLTDPDSGEETGPLLGFTASLSRASQVQFDPEQCAALDGAETVQAALHQLADAPVLVPAGGNGQIGTPGTDLAAPVKVTVMACGAAAPDRTVRFTVIEGKATAETAGTEVTGRTGADGTASCHWQLGSGGPVQVLTATLLDTNGVPEPRALPLTFLAGVAPERLTVTRVELPSGTAVVDGAFVAASDLAATGTAVVLDGEPGDVVAEGPTLIATLDLPYPLSESDRTLWNQVSLVGSLPLGLRGTVAKATVGTPPAPAISWTPAADTQAFLENLFTRLGEVVGGDLDRIRGHVRLAGSVLGTDAADVSRWFWLVAKVTNLVLVPHREGLFQGWAQRAIALSLPRDALRHRLRAGITVADVALDLKGAEAAAKRIFNNAQVRPLRLVVDVRYAPAGAAVKDGLAAVNVDMELVDGGADPAAKAAELLGNNEKIDGVLTDAASTAAVEAVAGFTKPVPL